ncbi:MAG: YihA family ribosome biogenesis GTP-binding protein, partial [Sneathiella sp.]
LKSVMEKTQDELKKRPAAHPDILLTSSNKGTGIAELRAELASLAE